MNSIAGQYGAQYQSHLSASGPPQNGASGTASYMPYSPYSNGGASLQALLQNLIGSLEHLNGIWGSLGGGNEPYFHHHGNHSFSPPPLQPPPQPLPINQTDSTPAQAIKNSYNDLLGGIQNTPLGQSTTQTPATYDSSAYTTTSNAYVDQSGDKVVQTTIDRGEGSLTSTTQTLGPDGSINESTQSTYTNSDGQTSYSGTTAQTYTPQQNGSLTYTASYNPLAATPPPPGVNVSGGGPTTPSTSTYYVQPDGSVIDGPNNNNYDVGFASNDANLAPGGTAAHNDLQALQPDVFFG